MTATAGLVTTAGTSERSGDPAARGLAVIDGHWQHHWIRRASCPHSAVNRKSRNQEQSGAITVADLAALPADRQLVTRSGHLTSRKLASKYPVLGDGSCPLQTWALESEMNQQCTEL